MSEWLAVWNVCIDRAFFPFWWRYGTLTAPIQSSLALYLCDPTHVLAPKSAPAARMGLVSFVPCLVFSRLLSAGVLSTMLGLVDSNTHPFGNGYSSSNPWQVNSFHPDGWSNSLGAEASAITDRVHGPYPPNTPSSCDLPAYPHSCTVDLCQSFKVHPSPYGRYHADRHNTYYS